jgi:hypothetical protein
MIYKFRVTDKNGIWASYKIQADTEQDARLKSADNLQEDVRSGSLLQDYTLELMEDKP